MDYTTRDVDAYDRGLAAGRTASVATDGRLSPAAAYRVLAEASAATPYDAGWTMGLRHALAPLLHGAGLHLPPLGPLVPHVVARHTAVASTALAVTG